MKKTLIALAALAATGATFAQATISGNIGVSWQQNAAFKSDGSHIQGLSVNDGEIYIAATEDLGGGMSATARGGFTMRGRGTSIMDRDATVSLKGNFGLVTAGAVRSCGSLVSVQSGAVTGTAYSANESEKAIPLDTCSIVDVLMYTLPVGPVMMTATYGEFAGGVTYYNALSTPVTVASLDSKGNVGGVTFTDVTGVYTAGPVMVSLGVTTFNVVYNKAVDKAALTQAGFDKDVLVIGDGLMRTRLVGTYDLGLAKFGLGYQNKTMGLADQYVASVAVPYGNALFGLDYTGRGAQGTIDKGTAGAKAAKALFSVANGDAASSSIGVGVTYNFSKTTNLNASYITYTDAGRNTITPTAATLDTEYRIRLLKSF
jgi:Gram-negative porin